MSEPPPGNLVSVLQVQGHFCRKQGAPFSASVLEALAERVAAPGPVARLLQPWREADRARLFADATALRLLGGLHFLKLTGAAPELAEVYPSEQAAAEPPPLGPALDAVLARHEPELAAFMRSPPQTNEVRRAVCLLGGFLTVTAETGLPLSVLEIGASAGLLQNFDRFRYETAHWALGEATATVHLPTEWTGPSPPVEAGLRVAARRACDRSPLDVADEMQALRLQAYVWAEQFDRLARVRAAIALARETGVQVERADAADWIAVHARPTPGLATVLFHSVMWQYMPAGTQAAVRAGVEAAGAAASPGAPFAWLRMEPPETPTDDSMEVRLTLWPGGEERLLGRCHPHGAWVAWGGAQSGA